MFFLISFWSLGRWAGLELIDSCSQGHYILAGQDESREGQVWRAFLVGSGDEWDLMKHQGHPRTFRQVFLESPDPWTPLKQLLSRHRKQEGPHDARKLGEALASKLLSSLFQETMFLAFTCHECSNVSPLVTSHGDRPVDP